MHRNIIPSNLTEKEAVHEEERMMGDSQQHPGRPIFRKPVPDGVVEVTCLPRSVAAIVERQDVCDAQEGAP